MIGRHLVDTFHSSCCTPYAIQVLFNRTKRPTGRTAGQVLDPESAASHQLLLRTYNGLFSVCRFGPNYQPRSKLTHLARPLGDFICFQAGKRVGL